MSELSVPSQFLSFDARVQTLNTQAEPHYIYGRTPEFMGGSPTGCIFGPTKCTMDVSEVESGLVVEGLPWAGLALVPGSRVRITIEVLPAEHAETL